MKPCTDSAVTIKGPNLLEKPQKKIVPQKSLSKIHRPQPRFGISQIEVFLFNLIKT